MKPDDAKFFLRKRNYCASCIMISTILAIWLKTNLSICLVNLTSNETVTNEFNNITHFQVSLHTHFPSINLSVPTLMVLNGRTIDRRTTWKWKTRRGFQLVAYTCTYNLRIIVLHSINYSKLGATNKVRFTLVSHKNSVDARAYGRYSQVILKTCSKMMLFFFRFQFVFVFLKAQYFSVFFFDFGFLFWTFSPEVFTSSYSFIYSVSILKILLQYYSISNFKMNFSKTWLIIHSLIWIFFVLFFSFSVPLNTDLFASNATQVINIKK